MALLTYYPEMGEQKPEAQIEASLSYSGKHYFLYTPLALTGRGVELRFRLGGGCAYYIEKAA